MTEEIRKFALPQGVDELFRESDADRTEEKAVEAFANFVSDVRDRLLDATKIAWLALVVATIAVFCGEYRNYQRGAAAVAEIEMHRESWRAKVAQVEQMKVELTQRNAQAAQLIRQLETLHRQRTPPQASPNGISPNADQMSSL